MLKLKSRKQRILKTVVTVFHYSTEKHKALCEISEQFFFITRVQNIHFIRKLL